LFGFGYPRDVWELYGAMVPRVEPGDLEAVAAPLDFLGVNYYSRSVVRHGGQGPLFVEHVRPEGEYTYMNWEVYPDGI
ncbi:glycosyl hydrolase family protein, partial [Klebsiella pneumoniae]|nr:glycosyl hydrolase family protein [Klebsiella pneumoniae]